MLVAAAVTYGLHRLLLLQKGRVVIDRETGEEIVLTSKHSLFFMPVRWWPAIFVVLGLVSVIVRPQANAEALIDTDVKLVQAGECGLRGDFSTAIRLATEVIDRQPSYAMAYVLRGTAYRRVFAGDADLDRAIELDPRMSEAYTQRAGARQQSQMRGFSKQILDDLNRPIELDATNALAHILRGNALADLNEYEAAIANYDQAWHLNPRSYSALAGRASSKLSLGRLDEARRDLQRALELDPPAEDRRQIEELLQFAQSQGQ